MVLQTRTAFDGEVKAGTQPEDLNNVNLGLVHPLTGPLYVQGAQPGWRANTRSALVERHRLPNPSGKPVRVNVA